MAKWVTVPIVKLTTQNGPTTEPSLLIIARIIYGNIHPYSIKYAHYVTVNIPCIRVVFQPNRAHCSPSQQLWNQDQQNGWKELQDLHSVNTKDNISFMHSTKILIATKININNANSYTYTCTMCFSMPSQATMHVYACMNNVTIKAIKHNATTMVVHASIIKHHQSKCGTTTLKLGSKKLGS